MLRVLAASLLLLAAAPLSAEEIHGKARVIDAGTLEISGQAIRLYGIAVPVAGDTCVIRNRLIDCGRIAVTALMDFTAGATVRCRTIESRQPPVARCTVDGYDLSEGMIYTGWARPLPDAPQRLRNSETIARKRNHGLWQGSFPPAVDSAAR